MSNKSKTRSKESRKRIRTLILLIFLTAVFLIVSTYAWFSTQRDVYLTGLEGTVQVAQGLQISLDAESWSQTVSIESSILSGIGNGISNMIEGSDGMKPVSTDGTAGHDVLQMISGEYSDGTLSGAQLESEGSTGKYYAFDIFLLNTSATSVDYDKLLLKVGDGNSTVTALNKDTGLESSVRVGFALMETYESTLNGETAVLPSQTNIINNLVTATNKVSKVAIWEPNAEKHTTSVVNMNLIKTPIGTSSSLLGSGTGITVGTNDVDGKGNTYVSFEDGDLLYTYAIADSKYGTDLSDIFIWADDDNAEVAKQVTLQTESDVSEDKQLIDTDGNDFEIKANAVSRIRVYVWIEGQDVDAQNLASFGGTLTVNLGIEKAETQS